MFGNPNYTLTVDGGKLVVRWGDSSDRDQPLTVWYNWNGTKFVVDHAKLQGPFLTSYDCRKATKEMDRAICYSPSVAALDLELGRIYRETLQKLRADQKQDFQKQQREWLARREKTCTIYKWWVDCLKTLQQAHCRATRRDDRIHPSARRCNRSDHFTNVQTRPRPFWIRL